MEIKNAFNGLIRRLHTAEKQVSEQQNISIGTSYTEKPRGKRLKTKGKKKQNPSTEYPRTLGQLLKVSNICNGNSRQQRTKERTRRDI